MKKNFKLIALMVFLGFFCGNTVNAADYVGFPYIFNYIPGGASSANHVTQIVEVQGNAKQNAYAMCTSYSYTGNKPVLTVTSASSNFPTYSTSITGTTSRGQAMKYTKAIPPTNKTVTFRGSVTNYTSFTIVAKVKG